MSYQILVSKKRIKYLEDRDRMLSHLEAEGVDNWDGYSSPPVIITIIVNGKEIEWEDTDDTYEISYRDVMALAGFKDRYFIMAYSNADDDPSSGSLTKDSDPVIIKNGTIFNVVDTSKA